MFFEAMDVHGKLDMNPNPMDPYDSRIISNETINCPVTSDNTNEPSTQRTNWRYHCSMTYVTQLTSQSNRSVSQNEGKWKLQWRKHRTVAFNQYKLVVSNLFTDTLPLK